MDEVKVKNIFAAVSDKSVLDLLLETFDANSVKFWGTEGTVNYLKSKGFSAQSVISGFDFNGRVKSLDKKVFAAILADRSKSKHIEELKRLWNQDLVIARSPSTLLRTTKQSKDRHVPRSGTRDDSYGDWEPIDAVIVDLYPLDKNNFPESMDIGGQALIRAAIKNYKNVSVAFDAQSIKDLAKELRGNNQSTTLSFRKTQAQKAAKFIAERCEQEVIYFD